MDNPETIEVPGDHWINSIGRNYRHLYLHPPVEGYCFPAQCSGRDMQTVLSDVFKSLSAPVKVEVYEDCDNDPSVEFPPIKVFSM